MQSGYDNDPIKKESSAYKGLDTIIYNVTVKVAASVAAEWLEWQISKHGPEMLATGCFTAFNVLQLLEVDDTEGPTFVVQYKTTGIESYQRYIDEFSEVLRRKAFAKWSNNFIAFRTVMQAVH